MKQYIVIILGNDRFVRHCEVEATEILQAYGRGLFLIVELQKTTIEQLRVGGVVEDGVMIF